MGRQRLDDYVREVTIKGYENIHNTSIDFEWKCIGDEEFSFKELKDGYAAFRERVCAPEYGFIDADGDCYENGKATLRVLAEIQSSRYKEEHELKEVGFERVETYVSLLQTKPSTGHFKLADDLTYSYIFSNYLTGCTTEELSSFVKRLKTSIPDEPDDLTDEMGQKFQYTFLKFFRDLDEQQMKSIQREILDLFMSFFEMSPTMSTCLRHHIGKIIWNLSKRFPDSNVYDNFRDVNVFKHHGQVISNLLCSYDFDVERLYVREIFHFLIKSAKKANVAKELFEDWAEMLGSMVERRPWLENDRDIYSYCFKEMFRDMKKDENNLKPDPKIFEATVKVLLRIIAAKGKTMNETVQGVVREALSDCICRYTDVPSELAYLLLKLWLEIVKTGLTKLVEYLWCCSPDFKNIVWKNHIPGVKLILKEMARFGEDNSDLQSLENFRECVKYMSEFLEGILKPLSHGKLLRHIQDDLVDCVYQCLTICSPEKSRLASVAAHSKNFVLAVKKDKELIDHILDITREVLKNPDFTWTFYTQSAVHNILQAAITSYNRNGKLVPDSHAKKFIEIFLICCEGEEVQDKLIPGPEEPSVFFQIYRDAMKPYMIMIQHLPRLTDFVPVTKYLMKWAKVGYEDGYDQLRQYTFIMLDILFRNIPSSLGHLAPQAVEFFLDMDNCSEVKGMVTAVYPFNPEPVQGRLQEFFDKIEELKDEDQFAVIQILTDVAERNPQVYTVDHVKFLMDLSLQVSRVVRPSFFPLILSVAKRNAKVVIPHFKELKNDAKYHKETLSLRAIIVGTLASAFRPCCKDAIDYLMGFANRPQDETFAISMGQLCLIVKEEQSYFEQKYKTRIEKIKDTTRDVTVKTICEDLLKIIEGKDYDEICDAIRHQQNQIVSLDIKVTATIDTVVNIGEQVIKQSEEISVIQNNVDDLDERMEDAEEEIDETKAKVEEIDNKTMTNAPKWSRDLTKLMNPEAEADWRLLASRLGYSRDDVKGWSQQNDPCMALLSEWYATHKITEATKGLLTVLQEMNRSDGVIIVENAMKAAEGVVEDEDFEYPNPPPVFISYQWGVQEEVKLLKQHLNMAGYECWMDIGQMGGGDKLFEKIDKGIRGAKVIISCTTEKYAKSPNCNREVGLSVTLQKPIIPLLMEKMSWPPEGPMGPVFSEYLFVRFFQRSGEETNDQRYWPKDKFQELLMQLSFYVPPDQKLLKPEYANWWAPAPQEVKIVKKPDKGTFAKTQTEQTEKPTPVSPQVFLSYQWGRQPQVKLLYQRLTQLGYTVWMDIYQMGGGDSLYDKIDRGMRGCNAVVSCITPKYALSANCRREVSLADALKKPIIPLMLEQMKWPPDGPMSMVFTELLYINMHRDEEVQSTWKGEKFDELILKLQTYTTDSTLLTSSRKTTREVQVKQESSSDLPKPVSKTGKDTAGQSEKKFQVGNEANKVKYGNEHSDRASLDKKELKSVFIASRAISHAKCKGRTHSATQNVKPKTIQPYDKNVIRKSVLQNKPDLVASQSDQERTHGCNIGVSSSGSPPDDTGNKVVDSRKNGSAVSTKSVFIASRTVSNGKGKNRMHSATQNAEPRIIQPNNKVFIRNSPLQNKSELEASQSGQERSHDSNIGVSSSCSPPGATGNKIVDSRKNGSTLSKKQIEKSKNRSHSENNGQTNEPSGMSQHNRTGIKSTTCTLL